jgi:hypothetical protein
MQPNLYSQTFASTIKRFGCPYGFPGKTPDVEPVAAQHVVDLARKAVQLSVDYIDWRSLSLSGGKVKHFVTRVSKLLRNVPLSPCASHTTTWPFAGA